MHSWFVGMEATHPQQSKNSDPYDFNHVARVTASFGARVLVFFLLDCERSIRKGTRRRIVNPINKFPDDATRLQPKVRTGSLR
jgi:hypothetical protein